MHSVLQSMFDFLIPLRQLLFPSENDQRDWESSRTRALIFGLPAIVAIIVAIIMLGFTQIGQKNRLETWYSGILETAQSDYQSKFAMLSAQKGLAASMRDPEQQKKLQDDIEVLEQDTELLKEKEQIFLSKLIDLDPDNPDYKYRLAMSHQNADKEKQLALLMALAPENEPVYYRAHVFMARTYFAEAQKTANYGEKKLLLEKALIQANHCLVQESNDTNAKAIKAKVLQESELFAEAAEIYSELFASEPGYYRDLAIVNQALGRDNTIVLESALDKYAVARNNNKDDDTKVWVACWVNLVQCWSLLERYQVAIDNLEDEYQRQERDPVRKKFLSNQLSVVYSRWATETDMISASPEVRRLALDRIVLAHEHNPQNSGALKLLAWLVANDENLSALAREVYDPYKDPNPPADVLSELGVRSLQLKEYEQAIDFFKRARNKDTQNPIVLNNLAFTLLVSQTSEKSAAEALTLVEEGMRLLASSKNPSQYATFLLATRGEAQKQLGRMEDAIASFERALRWRPEDEKIIKSLIVCYEGLIDEQAEVYRDYLKQVQTKSNSGVSTN